MKSVQIRSFSGPYFPAFRLNTERYLSLFSPSARKYGPEKTPYLDTFHAMIYSRSTVSLELTSRCFLYTHLNFATVVMDRFLIGAILEGAALIIRVRLTLERCGAY